MKTIRFINRQSILLLLVTVFFLSCSSDDSSSTGTNSISSVTSVVGSGTWKITYYFDTDKEETSNFSGHITLRLAAMVF